MSGRSSGNAPVGISFLGLLGIAFIVLRLTHVIDWSWWWVTLPLWGGFAATLGALLCIGAVGALVTISSGKRGPRWPTR